MLGEVATLAGALLAGGAAFGGVKVALNGTRARVQSMERALAEHAKSDEALAREVISRLARIETILTERES